MTLEDISSQIKEIVVLVSRRFNNMNSRFDKTDEQLEEINAKIDVLAKAVVEIQAELDLDSSELEEDVL